MLEWTSTDHLIVKPGLILEDNFALFLSTDLLHADKGMTIDFGAMPTEGVARCRAAWSRFVGRETCVVYGGHNPGNIRITSNRVALIDWDESHVDVPDLDLVLPHNAAGLDGDALEIAGPSSVAWEAAVCWDDEFNEAAC